MRRVTNEHTTLSHKEIKTFLHNAQLALCDAVNDEAISKKLFLQKQDLVHLFKYSTLTAGEIALVLVSAAWDIFDAKGGQCESFAGTLKPRP